MIRKDIISYFLVILLLSAPLALAGNVDVTTYYPAPYGEYEELKTTGNTYLATGPGKRVGIGTVSPDHPLQMSGGAYSDGAAWIDASSIEYKKDITPLTVDTAIATLNELSPVTFRYKSIDEADLRVGFIAEDVPALVSTKDRKGLSAMELIGVLTKVVQHQQAEIEKLKALIK